MSRNATASWSGYCHQGKVGFLVSLRKIINLDFNELANHSMELETQEDIKISRNDIVIEVHQVKAYTASNRFSAYTSALKAFDTCAGLNYLHTVCEISNWNQMTGADNPKNIERYPYSNATRFCDLNDINLKIKNEISNVLFANGDIINSSNEGWCELAFHELLAILDEKIRYEHRNKPQNEYEVKFSLQQILDIISQQATRCRAVTFAIRQSIYNQYQTFVVELQNAGYPNITIDQQDKVELVIKEIGHMNDSDLEDFLVKVFPDTTGGRTLASCVLTDPFYREGNFRSTFINTLIRIDRQQLILQDGLYPHYSVDFNYLLTAIHSNEDDKPIISVNILKNRKLNAARYETDFIINETYEGSLNEFAQRVMPSNKLFEAKDMKFISRQNAIDKLNQ